MSLPKKYQGNLWNNKGSILSGRAVYAVHRSSSVSFGLSTVDPAAAPTFSEFSDSKWHRAVCLPIQDYC